MYNVVYKCIKASKMAIFVQQRQFFDKKPYKIQTNGARDLKLGFKNSMEYPLCDPICFKNFFPLN